MQRGNGNFNTLFGNQDIDTIPTERKGRNDDLIAARNEKLIHRYFYYGFYTDKRFDAICDELVAEFDISARRITDIVGDCLNELQKLRNNPPSLRELQKKYPFMVWG